MAPKSNPDADKVGAKQPTEDGDQQSNDGSKQGKKSKTSSRGARRLKQIEKRVTKATKRVTKAANKGVTNYIEHRDKSAEKRRDGAIVDYYENVSHGVSKALSEASPVLHDAAEALNTRRARKQIRRVARGLGKFRLFG